MQLSSPAFAAGQAIPAEFTCTGANTSPPLAWADAPSGTKSFALLLEDPDAPGGTFRHWGVYDLATDRHELAAGAGQSGSADLKQARNDFGDNNYGGPCPPPGDRPHHYVFRVMALDVEKLSPEPGQVADIVDAMHGHVLASAFLVADYQR